jgi:DNA sulfur modification protein DndC
MPGNQFQDLKDSLRELYLGDDRPWLVGFSGGKDSTLVAQLIFEAVQNAPANQTTDHGHKCLLA